MTEPSYYVNIPGYVMELKIEPMAKLCFGIIASLTRREGYCYASNASISEQLDVTERSIQNYIKSLSEAGVIVLDFDSGNRRMYLAEASTGKNLHGGVKEFSWGGEEIFVGGRKNFRKSNIVNNKAKNIDKTLMSENAKEPYPNQFLEFWEAYPPSKSSKAKSFKSYQRALKEADHETIIAGARAYADDCRRQRKSIEYIAHASTFLNEKRWEIDYSAQIAGSRANGGRSTFDDVLAAASRVARGEMGSNQHRGQNL